jgi:O-6-methylguanine DNA methyltransferase
MYRYNAQTEIGELTLVSDDQNLLFLDFNDQHSQTSRLTKLFGHNIQEKKSDINALTEGQLKSYFAGNLKNFSIPLQFTGTEFRKKTWESLLSIPYGTTITYKQQAELLGEPKSYRAVASANGANNIAIIVPCHRVIGTNGKLTGYSSGLHRKKFLLELETKNSN